MKNYTRNVVSTSVFRRLTTGFAFASLGFGIAPATCYLNSAIAAAPDRETDANQKPEEAAKKPETTKACSRAGCGDSRPAVAAIASSGTLYGAHSQV